MGLFRIARTGEFALQLLVHIVRVGGGQLDEKLADGGAGGGQHGGAFFGGGLGGVTRASVGGYLAPLALGPGPALAQGFDAKLLGVARASFG